MNDRSRPNGHVTKEKNMKRLIAVDRVLTRVDTWLGENQ